MDNKPDFYKLLSRADKRQYALGEIRDEVYEFLGSKDLTCAEVEDVLSICLKYFPTRTMFKVIPDSQ